MMAETLVEDVNSWPEGDYILNTGEWTDPKTQKRYKRGATVHLDAATATRIGNSKVSIQTYLEPPQDGQPAKVKYTTEPGLKRVEEQRRGPGRPPKPRDDQPRPLGQ